VAESRTTPQILASTSAFLFSYFTPFPKTSTVAPNLHPRGSFAHEHQYMFRIESCHTTSSACKKAEAHLSVDRTHVAEKRAKNSPCAEPALALSSSFRHRIFRHGAWFRHLFAKWPRPSLQRNVPVQVVALQALNAPGQKPPIPRISLQPYPRCPSL
jgi:hypothetical protein